MLNDKRFCSDCGYDTSKQKQIETQNKNVIKCSKCGFEYENTMKFCPQCGDKYNPCPKCGTDMPEDATVCSSCGYEIPQPCPFCGLHSRERIPDFVRNVVSP